ncbi:MAG: helix-turn-helix domain-containing protein [Proteobacteria bacterium]|nr:helix-turn-helix domain-containing protein [Pseudomonadota bacterium]
MDLTKLGQRVREHRTRRGWSQKQLCERAGVSPRFLVQVERGEANPSISRLSEIAQALEVSVTALITGLGPQDATDEIATHAADLDIRTRRRLLLRLRGQVREKVALVGLRGAGKSTIGQALAARTGARFVELDRRVEELAGMSLSEVFEFHGAERYRELARGALDQALSEPGASVLEIGGSLVHDAELYAALRAACRVVWLRASPQQHLDRVRAQGDLRPLAGWADPLGQLTTILGSRSPLYALAELHLETQELGVEGVVDALVASR